MSARRIKLGLILSGIVLAAVTLLTWTQPWFGLELHSGQQLTVSGQAAAPSLSALGLASLALVAALSIAGRVLRVVLGVIQAGIGALTVLTAITALVDPVAASARTVTDATAVSGAQSIAALVATVSTTGWPWLALLAGALSALVGLAVALTASRWPGAARKYEATAAEGAGTAGAWDALSHGDDPT